MSRLTWSRQPRETGLRAVCAGPRGWILKVDGVRVGDVSAAYKGLSRDIRGWDFMARGDGIPWKNSAAEGVFYPDDEAAKTACKTYVAACLAAKESA